MLVALIAVLAVAAPAQATRVSASDRRQIDAVLNQFVRHAVLRNHPEAVWHLATATLRGGTSRHDWAHGNLSVYPYPAGGRTFRFTTVIWANRNDVGTQLILQPKHRLRKRVAAMAFTVGFLKIHGRWLVDNFTPSATFAPVGARPKVVGPQDFMPAVSVTRTRAFLGGWWWLVIVSVVALAPATLLAIWVVGFVKSRDERRWFVLRKRTALPPLRTPVGGHPKPGK
jgi:hypothetical protein